MVKANRGEDQSWETVENPAPASIEPDSRHNPGPANADTLQPGSMATGPALAGIVNNPPVFTDDLDGAASAMRFLTFRFLVVQGNKHTARFVRYSVWNCTNWQSQPYNHMPPWVEDWVTYDAANNYVVFHIPDTTIINTASGWSAAKLSAGICGVRIIDTDFTGNISVDFYTPTASSAAVLDGSRS